MLVNPNFTNDEVLFENEVDSSLSSSSKRPVENKVITQALQGKSDVNHSHLIKDITNFPSYLEPLFKQNTWYPVGDDSYIGSHGVAGGLGILGNNGTTKLDFCKQDDPDIYKSISFDGTTLTVDGNCEYAKTAGNANTVGGLSPYHVATLDETGNSQGNNLQFYCKFNKFGDNRYGLGINSNTDYQVRVDFASNAESLSGITSGSEVKPVYFSNGKPVACKYTLEKSVPADALFSDTTYTEATTTKSGLLSSTDKAKLDSIVEGANRIEIDNFISDSSINPVQNKVIYNALIEINNNLGEKLDSTLKGENNGLAELDASGKIPIDQIPDSANPVVKGIINDNFTEFVPSGKDEPVIPDSSKIYIDTNVNISYQWNGNKFIEIGSSLKLGETSDSAYAGDKGKELSDYIHNHANDSDIHISSDERTKWNKAEQNVQSDWSITDTTSDAYIKNKPSSLPASDVSAWAKAATKPSYSAAEVGADPVGSADNALTEAKKYTDTHVQEEISAHESNTTLHISSDERTKWNKADQNVQSDWSVSDSSSDAFIKNKPTSLPASDVSAWAKAATKPTYTADEVGADAKGSASSALSDAKEYTDAHSSNVLNPHAVTKAQVGLGNVDNTSDMDKPVSTAVQSAISTHEGNTTLHITSAERTKWNKAEQNVQSDWSVSDSSSDAFIKNKPTSLPASDVSAWAKAATKPTYTADEVGADAKGSADKALSDAKDYTDTEIAGIINGAPTTLDTLGEIADAMAENKNVVDALNEAIGTKATSTDLTSHTTNKSNPHGVTKSQVGLGNVPNVATNDQTPTFTESSSLTKLTSGEKLSVAFGKISKAVTDLISHVGDNVKHITSTERTNWNVAKTHADSAHAPSNAQANIIETVKVNGSALTPNSKAVDITVPTNNNQLTNGAGYITSSGTAKTISDTLPISKGGTGKTTGVDAANVLINSLSTGDSTPTDADYYVSQYVGGGTNTTTYHRRPMSALWSYIQSKLATVATSGSYNDLSNKPTIPSVGNGTITIKQNGTSKGTFTTNQSDNTTIELTDNNTTYSPATTSANGLMSAEDKAKLDGIAAGSNKITVDSALSSTSTNPVQNKVINSALAGKAASSHTHSYAGSSSAGGSATSAVKLDTSSAGSATQPVYFSDGKPVATTYTLGKSVPSDAEFTDTVYTHPTTSGNKHIPSGGSSGQILRWSADGTAVWGNDNNTTYNDATTSTHGLMSVSDKKALDVLKTPYAICSTERNDVNKVAELENFVLSAGVTIAVKFTDTGTENPASGSLTLNVNNTGAKTIKYIRNGAKLDTVYTVSNFFCDGLTHIFTYDGNYWLFMDWNADRDTTYTPATLGFGYGLCFTEEEDTEKTVSMSSYSLVTGGIVAVKFAYNVPESATLNINNTGAKKIQYKGTDIFTWAIRQGDIATFIYNGSDYILLSRKQGILSPVVTGGNYDNCLDEGLYEIFGNSTNPANNAPNGNDTDNNFYVFVQRHDSNYLVQTATSVRNPMERYTRGLLNSEWSSWTKLELTDTTYDIMTSATESSDGKSGLVPAPSAGKQNSFLRGDGTWADIDDIVVDSALSSTSTNPVQNNVITAALSSKATASHTHNYAGSSSSGGSATSAVKLDTSAGSASQPVYFSDGKPVPCTTLSLNDYVVGTQTASTNAFTGNLAGVSALYDGLSIRYYLPYAGTSSAATLKLTLTDAGTTTAAIPVYRNSSSTFTNQCGAGSILYLTYKSSVNRWVMSAQYDYDTIDRLRHSGPIKCNASTAIVAGEIIVAKDGLYYPLKSGISFDITYPLLFSMNSINVNATNLNVYIALPMAVAPTQSITLTAYKPLYIKGKLSGTLFTPISTTPLTQTIPTSADGYQYILLGNVYSTTAFYLLPDHPIFEYTNGSFGLIGGDAKTVYTHPTTSGNKHIPSGGSSGQILRWSADGTAVWGNDNNTTYNDATTSTHGLMSVSDKKALDVLKTPYATCATGRATADKVATLENFTLSAGVTIAVKFTDTGTENPASGSLTLNVNNTGAKIICYFRNGNKAPLTYNNAHYFYNNTTHIFTYDGKYWMCMDWNADNNTTYSVATISANGLMSAEDKSKLDGIAAGANKTTVDSALSSTSTNPVQNKVINSALAGKAASSHTHTKSQITDFPSSLPANGGNADTVDGVHISCTNDAVSGSNWFAAFTDGNNLRAIDPTRAYVGNAGNADTVNHVDGFPSNNVLHSSNWLNSPNCNDLTTGIVGYTDSNTGAPVNGWCTVMAFNCAHFFVQIGIEYSTGNLFVRSRYQSSSSWPSWTPIYGENNKQVITGSATIGANYTTCITNHGFNPKVVLWWTTDRIVYSATSFNTTSFDVHEAKSYDRAVSFVLIK